jgi:hypothetical protein
MFQETNLPRKLLRKLLTKDNGLRYQTKLCQVVMKVAAWHLGVYYESYHQTKILS